MTYRPEACGENHCLCYCPAEPHPCGCDCPHRDDCNCLACTEVEER